MDIQDLFRRLREALERVREQAREGLMPRPAPIPIPVRVDRRAR